jgi:hypothetical protein
MAPGGRRQVIPELSMKESAEKFSTISEGPCAEMENGHLHVEVLDSEPTVALAPLPLDLTRARGRGLAIVDALASDRT